MSLSSFCLRSTLRTEVKVRNLSGEMNEWLKSVKSLRVKHGAFPKGANLSENHLSVAYGNNFQSATLKCKASTQWSLKPTFPTCTRVVPCARLNVSPSGLTVPPLAEWCEEFIPTMCFAARISPAFMLPSRFRADLGMRALTIQSDGSFKGSRRYVYGYIFSLGKSSGH